MFWNNFWFHLNCAVNLSGALLLRGNDGVGSLFEAYTGLGHSVSKRYLVDPESGTQFIMFIFGIGIPVHQDFTSVTVGLTIRLLYHLPSNSSYYTYRIYEEAPVLHSRRMHNLRKKEVNPTKRVKQNLREFFQLSASGGNYKVVGGSQEFDHHPNIPEENSKIKDHFSLHEDIGQSETQQLSETSGRKERVTIDAGINVVDENYEKEKYEDSFQEADRKQRVTRWTLYQFLENIIQRRGYCGRPCMLRAICESASAPLVHSSLLAELLHILLTRWGRGGEDISAPERSRSRRYLVYPDGGPARVQFIIGFGVPIDLEQQAVTAGIVIKLQYHLPTNSTEYTTRIFDATQLVSSRFMNKGGNRIDENTDTKMHEQRIPVVSENKIKSDIFENNNTNLDETTETVEHENIGEQEPGILVDIDFDSKNDNTEANELEYNVQVEARDKRSLLYMEGETNMYQDAGENDGSEMPLSEAIRLQEKKDEEMEKSELNTRKKSSRWDLYRIFETLIEKHGFSGRACLLRTVCEAAGTPFTHHNGLLGELAHIVFTPSTTNDKLSHHADNEFHAAERLGRDVGIDCGNIFPECETSILDMFTDISKNMLQNF